MYVSVEWIYQSPSPIPACDLFHYFFNFSLNQLTKWLKETTYPWVNNPGLSENFVYSGLLKCFVQPYFKELSATSPGKACQFKDLPIRKTLLIFSPTQQFLFFSNLPFSLLGSFETHSESTTPDCPAGFQFPELGLHIFVRKATQSLLEINHFPFLMTYLHIYYSLWLVEQESPYFKSYFQNSPSLFANEKNIIQVC